MKRGDFKLKKSAIAEKNCAFFWLAGFSFTAKRFDYKLKICNRRKKLRIFRRAKFSITVKRFGFKLKKSQSS